MEKERISTVVFGILDNIPGSKGKILLLHEKDKPPPPLLKLAGGTVEPSESVEEALVREFEEETGLKVQICGKQFYERTKNGAHGTHRIVVFMVSYIAGEIKEGEEIEVIHLLSPEEAMLMIRDGKIVKTHAEPLEDFINLYYGLEFFD